MKKCTIFRSRKYGPTLKVVLALLLTGAGVVVTLPVAWAYHNIDLGVGMEVAQVTLAFQVFIAVVLTTAGVGAGYLIDWAIRWRKSIFRVPQEGSCAEALIRLWGYEMTCQEEVDENFLSEINLFPTFDEIIGMINRPKRRGRKPTFPLEAWLPIAAKWENRDPMRDAFTLEDLIRERLGENSDGSQIVSAQAYYSTWRERALEEMKRQAAAKQAASQSNGDQP